MAIKQPPFVNGVMELTATQVTDITASLQSIQAAFVATDDVPECNTFYIVSTYNKANVGKEINGDTCDSLLASAVEEAPVAAPVDPTPAAG